MKQSTLVASCLAILLVATLILGYDAFEQASSPVAYISPSTQTAQVSGSSPKVITLTSGTTWTVPSDWNNSANTIEVIGGGGGGGGNNVAGSGGGSTAFGTSCIADGGGGGGSDGATMLVATGGGGSGGAGGSGDGSGSDGSGGGGGAYAKCTNVSLTLGSNVSIAIGQGGTASYPSTTVGTGYYSGGAGTTGGAGGGGGGAGATGNGSSGSGSSGGMGGSGTSVGGSVIAGGSGQTFLSGGAGNGGAAGGPFGGAGGTGNMTGAAALAASNGIFPGGGGGGTSNAGSGGGSHYVGNGANGEIVITYTPAGTGSGGTSGTGSGTGTTGTSSTPPPTSPSSGGASSGAQTYYVDYSSGSDSNSGTSSASPWKHAPGDPRAIGNANITLAPGATVAFKGGVIYQFDTSACEYIWANASGSAGQPITYESGSLVGWGTGMAQIDGTNACLTGKAAGVLDLNSQSNITVNGLQIYRNGVSSFQNYTALVSYESNSTAVNANIVIENNMLYGNDQDTTFGGIYVQGTYPGNGGTPSGFTITNNTIHDIDSQSILFRWAASNITISTNTIYHGGFTYAAEDVGDGMFFDGEWATVNGATVIGRPSNVLIEYNNMYDFPSKGDLIFEGLAGADHVTIAYNYFHSQSIAANQFGIDLSEGDTYSIHNNVFDQNTNIEGLIRIEPEQTPWPGATGGITLSNVSITNNTFYGYSQYGGTLWLLQNAALVSGVTFQNNIVYVTPNYDYDYIAAKDTSPITVPVANMASDYNIFYGLNGSYHTAFNKLGTEYSSLSAWQTSVGLDTHSISADPMFTSVAGGETGFTPQNGSPACSSGSGGTYIGAYPCSSQTVPPPVTSPSPSIPVTPPVVSAPTISSVTTSAITSSSASIAWTTSTAASGEVEYGVTSIYGSLTALIPALSTSHTVSLTGLAPNTSYNYAVVSTDGSGNIVTSSNATFTTLTNPDTTSPIVSVSAPVNNATISGSVTLGANASDPIVSGQTTSGIATIQFKLDGTSLGSPLTTAPYSGTWNTSGVSNGAHTIIAVATDGAGNVMTSNAVIVTVNNVQIPNPSPSTPPSPVSTGGTPVSSGGGGGGSGGATPSVGTFTPTVTQMPLKTPVVTATEWTTVTYGQTSPEIKTLQQALNAAGYVVAVSGPGSSGDETTYFGSATLTALKRYQCAVMSRCSGFSYGVADAATAQSLKISVIAPAPAVPASTVGYVFTRSLSLGSSGPDVQALQVLLNSRGFLVAASGPGSPGHETTYFGSATKAALIGFQKAYSISATGFFGLITMKEANMLEAQGF